VVHFEYQSNSPVRSGTTEGSSCPTTLHRSDVLLLRYSMGSKQCTHDVLASDSARTRGLANVRLSFDVYIDSMLPVLRSTARQYETHTPVSAVNSSTLSWGDLRSKRSRMPIVLLDRCSQRHLMLDCRETFWNNRN
jgi:hypothetical protein